MFLVHSCWGQFRLAYSQYTDSGWINPVDLGVPGQTPFILCAQDTTLYFSSYEYSGYGSYDILAASYHNYAVDSIWNLGPEINSSADESSPSLTSDGQKIFFLRGYTIMYSEKVNGQFGQPIALPECINDSSAYQQLSPRIYLDDSKLYFTRHYGFYRPGYLFVSYFLENAWQEPIQLNDNINSQLFPRYPDDQYSYATDPSFTQGGSKMYFTYNGFAGGEPGATLLYSQLTESAPSNDIALPSDFTLNVYPNPFNSQTIIELGDNCKNISNISIYNLSGQLVRTLPAHPKVIWDGRDNNGNALSSGIYFVKAASPGFLQTLKITLIR